MMTLLWQSYVPPRVNRKVDVQGCARCPPWLAQFTGVAGADRQEKAEGSCSYSPELVMARQALQQTVKSPWRTGGLTKTVQRTAARGLEYRRRSATSPSMRSVVVRCVVVVEKRKKTTREDRSLFGLDGGSRDAAGPARSRSARATCPPPATSLTTTALSPLSALHPIAPADTHSQPCRSSEPPASLRRPARASKSSPTSPPAPNYGSSPRPHHGAPEITHMKTTTILQAAGYLA